MKNILFNYQFAKTTSQSFEKIARLDGINMWVAILIKEIYIKKYNFIFPSELAGQKIDLEIHINQTDALSEARNRISLFMETPLIHQKKP